MPFNASIHWTLGTTGQYVLSGETGQFIEKEVLPSSYIHLNTYYLAVQYALTYTVLFACS